MRKIMFLIPLLLLAGCQQETTISPTTCNENQTLVDGVCVDQTPVCTAPEVLRDGSCILIPDPVITLSGDLEISVEAGTTYADPGASALYDGNEIEVLITGLESTDELGTFTVYYNATSIDGKHAVEKTRIVHVVDTTPPVVDFGGYQEVDHELGRDFQYDAVLVSDNYDGYEDIELIISGEVDVNTIGVYTVTYYAIDSHGNESNQVVKTVNIIMNEELPFTQRYLKDHTALYVSYKMQNDYTYAPMEWVHQALIIENGEYVPKLFFFLHNEVDGVKVLKKIEFICPSETFEYPLDDAIEDYAFELPIHCMTSEYLSIKTYAHDDYDPGKVWSAAMKIPVENRSVDGILSKLPIPGNLR